MDNIKKFEHRLYGRTRGRSNKKINILNYQKLVKENQILSLENSKDYILDIGTGYGETSIFLAKKFPNHIIVSCEKFIDGNLNLLKNINNHEIKNIKLYAGNVNEFLSINKKNEFFSSVWIFFPDPWPKKKHHKRRLITDLFLKKLYQYIKSKGQVNIATDSISYSRSILNSLYKNKNLFRWKNQNELYMDLKDYYKLETKFYKKATISGRKTSLLVLEKI